MSTLSAHKAYNKLDYLKLMLLSREGDRREGILLRQSKGWFQVGGMGHEALGAIAYALEPGDYLFPYYRDRAIMLARGMSTYEMALAYLAKRDSSSGGRQMPGHYSAPELNVFSTATPTGSTLIPACGAAWGMKLSGERNLAVASVGDAASRQGEFYEAIAFALQEQLPVIFVVEDNKYGISTPTEKFLPFHLDIFRENLPVKIDARHPDTVYEAAHAAAEKARSRKGPTVLWCDLDRLGSHTSSDDHRVYRSAADIESMMARDPIRLVAEELIKAGLLDQAGFEALTEEAAKEVDDAYLKAEKAQDPKPSEVLLHTWGESAQAVAPPIQSGSRTTMVQAIDATFRQALANDPKVIFFGQDIEDPKGGVFGLTKGLSEAFPKQVFNSPLAEATILGVAVGMAAYGMKPVFELQFIDFITPGWNQLCTNISSLRWRSFGHWKCPMVVYAPCGAYLPGGSLWHSQSNEAALAHIPGIRIAIPSTPEDAAALFWTGIHSDDPCFILLPKHLFREQVELGQVQPVPFGKAKVVQQGTDVTLVSWGNCIELAKDASTKVQASIEIIDLRSIVPCDYETITASVEKTGRLVVVHEDVRTCGFGQTVIAEMTRIPERWNLFLSPPQLVARDDVHIGFNPTYEYAALPNVDQVVEAIQTVMA